MATALSGHIDDRDGSPTRLETSAPCVHTSLRTSQAFGLLWRKLRRARALSGLGAISNPDRRDADGYLIATARPDNPAKPRPHLRRPRTHPAHRSRGRGTHHVLQIVAHQPPPAKATSFFTTPARPKSATWPTSPRPPRAGKSCARHSSSAVAPLHVADLVASGRMQMSSAARAPRAAWVSVPAGRASALLRAGAKPRPAGETHHKLVRSGTSTRCVPQACHGMVASGFDPFMAPGGGRPGAGSFEAGRQAAQGVEVHSNKDPGTGNSIRS